MKTCQGIEELVAIVDEGSMTAAAKALGTSVASISRQLDALEKRLGVQLVKRSTRRRQLTAAGEQLYQQAAAMIGGMRALADELRGRERELIGPIRITSAGGYVVEFLSPLLAQFASDHPRVSIELDVTTRIVDLLAEPVHLAIRFGRLRDSTLHGHKLFERRLVMCASPAYVKARGRPRRPSDLRRHDCLLGFGDRWSLVIDGRVRQVKITGRWRSNNGVALVEAAKAGLGILYQPETLVRRAVEEGTLVELMRKFSLTRIPVWAVYAARRRQLPARVQAFVDYLVSAARRG